MSDSLRNDIINANYVAGEQPTHVKLTNSVRQLETAIQRLGLAVGDLYTQQTQSSSGGPYDIDTLPSVGPNIARYLASAGWLNPRRFSRNLQTLEVIIAGEHSIFGDPPTYKGYTHYNRHEFTLPFPPIVFTSTEGNENLGVNSSYLFAPYWVISSPPITYIDVSATKVTTPVATLAALTSDGQYHVAPDGTITTFQPLEDNEAFTLTYKFHMIPDRYDGSSLNVIPDFSQLVDLCNVTLISGTDYQIVLPLYIGKRGWNDFSNYIPYNELFTFDSPTSEIDPQYEDQLYLPLAIRNGLSAGDPIPAGYIYLWNDTNEEIVQGVTFSYVDEYTIQAHGVALTVGTATYRVIVPGTTIGQTLSTIIESQVSHDHSGRYIGPEGAWMGHRIRHTDLLNLIDEGDGGNDSLGFVPSSIGPTRNPHPMYLHRYGFQYANSLSDAGNLHNSLMGSLVLSNIDGGLGTTANSWSIYFGGYPTVTPNTYGGRIRYNQDAGKDQLEITHKNVYIGEQLLVDGGGIAAADLQNSRIECRVGDSSLSRHSNVLLNLSSDVAEYHSRLYHSNNLLGSEVIGGSGIAFTLGCNWISDGPFADTWYRQVGLSAATDALKISIGEWGVCGWRIPLTYGSLWSEAEWCPANHTLGTGPDDASDFGILSKSQDPASGGPVLPNMVYSKNTYHAWITVKFDGSGVAPYFTIVDSFGIASCEVVNPLVFKVFLEHAGTNFEALCVNATPISLVPATGIGTSWQPIGVDNFGVQIFGWDGVDVVPLNLETTAAAISITVFYELA